VRVVLVVIAIVFVILAIFTAANWQVLTRSTLLSFVVFSVEGPLGVILLGVSLVLTLLVVAYAVLLRTSWLMETHRLNRHLEEQRELAEKAESSRIVALQQVLEREFDSLNTSLQTMSEAGLARIESAEQSLVKTIEDSANSIMANIGYLDDKMKGSS
jgi:uncharacterized integral membrane protein